MSNQIKLHEHASYSYCAHSRHQQRNPSRKKIFHWVENVIIYALIDRKVLSLQFRFTGVARPWSFSVYLEWNVHLLLIFLSILTLSPVLRMGNISASHCIKYESQPMMAGKLRIKPRFHCRLETSSQESPSFKLYYTVWVIYY